MKNIANADRPKSAAAMLPPRPLRGSGKLAQTVCNSDRREGKSCIPTLNQTFADSRILKISKFHTFRIADFGRSRDRLGIEDVRAYQLHLIAQKRSWSHINQTACALRFFRGVTLGRQEAFELRAGKASNGSLA